MDRLLFRTRKGLGLSLDLMRLSSKHARIRAEILAVLASADGSDSPVADRVEYLSQAGALLDAAVPSDALLKAECAFSQASVYLDSLSGSKKESGPPDTGKVASAITSLSSASKSLQSVLGLPVQLPTLSPPPALLLPASLIPAKPAGPVTTGDPAGTTVDVVPAPATAAVAAELSTAATPAISTAPSTTALRVKGATGATAVSPRSQSHHQAVAATPAPPLPPTLQHNPASDMTAVITLTELLARSHVMQALVHQSPTAAGLDQLLHAAAAYTQIVLGLLSTQTEVPLRAIPSSISAWAALPISATAAGVLAAACSADPQAVVYYAVTLVKKLLGCELYTPALPVIQFLALFAASGMII